MKRNDLVNTLANLQKGIKIGEEVAHADPLIIFPRLIVVLSI